MEGLHFSAVQQLQLELVEARERSGLLKEESAAPYPSTKDAPQFVHDKGHREARGSLNGKSAEHSNSNEENATNFAALGSDISRKCSPCRASIPAQPAGHPEYLVPVSGYLEPLTTSKIGKIQGNVSDSNDHGQELRNPLGKTKNGVSALISDIQVQPANSGAVVSDSNASGVAPLAVVLATHTNLSSAGKTSDSVLVDERSLLACIARTMPASGKIQISSTLPNRLVKMLAPLHWRDYKKIYGKLDDFVAAILN